MNHDVMFKLAYGLYVVSTKADEKDNGCIINTAMQITVEPNQMMVAVNKQNYTHDMICKSKEFNLSMLDESAPFSVFQNFGYQSGRNVEKFAAGGFRRSENGILYLPEYTSAYLSGKVKDIIDMGTHSLFLSEVTAGEMLSGKETMTYSYYQEYVKPKPEATKKKGYICKVCGYIYEGDELPPDYICPICKHGASDFKKL